MIDLFFIISDTLVCKYNIVKFVVSLMLVFQLFKKIIFLNVNFF